MATPSLPSTGSIVDFLKGQGKDSSYSARTKLYKDLGLSGRLGDYTGSASQNQNLLKELQRGASAPPKTTTPALDLTRSMGVQTTTPAVAPTKGKTTTPTAPTTPAAPKITTNPTTPSMGALDFSKFMQTANSTPATMPKVTTTPKTSSAGALDAAGIPGFAPTTPTPGAAPSGGSAYQGGSVVDYLNSVGQKSDFSSRAALAKAQGIENYTGTAAQNTQLLKNLRGGSGGAAAGGAAPATPTNANVPQQTQQLDTSTQESTGGLSASTIYPDIFNDSTPDEADLVNNWLNSSEGQLFLERQNLNGMNAEAKAEAAKNELEAKYKSDKETLEQNLSENGLAFSGIRGTKVKALADALAASTLDVDREFASTLLDANLDLREAILKGVAELAKDAQDERKEAIQQLNAIGYAVIGGQLVPTLSMRSAERADAAAVRAERQLEISEQRLALAEASNARAEAKFYETSGAGRSGGFDYVRQLMELNPNATRAELKAAALENTNLNTTEIDSVLDTVGLTPTQATEVAKSLVASNFDTTFFNLDATDLKEAKEAAKNTIRSTGGVIKVGGRTVTLNADQLSDLELFIDTVTVKEAEETKKRLGK